MIKGAHRTPVDGTDYFWIARGSLHRGFMRVTLQMDAPTGRPLLVTVRGNVLYDFPFPTMFAGVIPAIVRDAKKAGWEPESTRTISKLDLLYDGPLDPPQGTLERLTRTIARVTAKFV